MKKIYLLIIISLGLLLRVDAQALFEKGQSGLSISASAQDSYLEHGYFGSIVYSYKGAFDLYGTYGRFVYNIDNLRYMGMTIDQSPKETVIIVGARYWLLRSDPSEDRNINFGVWADYESESYSDQIFTSNGRIIETTSGSAFAMGFNFSINFHAQNRWNMQPYLWMGNVWATQKYTENGNEQSKKQSGAAAALGVMIQKQFKNGSSIWLTNSLDVDCLSRTADLGFISTLGYNFSFSKK